MRLLLTPPLLTIWILIPGSQSKYDLLLNNGHLIDPKNNILASRSQQ